MYKIHLEYKVNEWRNQKMNDENKNDILDKIEDKLENDGIDYRAELLDEDAEKKSYVPTMIIIVIIVLALIKE